MKAFVFTKTGVIEEKEVEDIRFDAEGENRFDCLMEPVYLSPCSSDVHTVYAGPGPRRENMILGHEGIGRVLQCGSEVKDFIPGDVVAVAAVMPDVPGGTGHEHMPFSGTKLGRNMNGMWAERYLVPQADSNLALIPEGVSPKEALMSVDVMAAAFSAVDAAEIREGQTVVISGTGAIGLMAAAAAKLKGAGFIIAIGSEKRKNCTLLAMRYGADIVVSYQSGKILASSGTFWDRFPGGMQELEELVRRVKESRSPLANSTGSPVTDLVTGLTEGMGADRIVLTGGTRRSLMEACDMLKYGSGICVNMAYIEGTEDVSLPVFSLGKGMAGKCFKFVLSAGGRQYIEEMLALLAAGVPDAGKLVTHELEGFESIPRALSMMKDREGGAIKVMVKI